MRKQGDVTFGHVFAREVRGQHGLHINLGVSRRQRVHGQLVRSGGSYQVFHVELQV